MTYNYAGYGDISPSLKDLVCNVADLDDITDLTISEVNEFLTNLDTWYQKYDLSLKDFE